MTLDQQLDQLIESFPKISNEKKYWLIRTQSGSLYETFRENHFVAIEHNEVPLSVIRGIEDEAKGDLILTQRLIREFVKKLAGTSLTDDAIQSEEEILMVKRPGLKANQIFKFVYEVKKGDIVIIPSVNSDVISFGEVQESHIGEFSPEQLRKMDNEYILKKKVKWIHDVARSDVDPYLYKLFMAHQALNEVGKYADVIERSMSNFFILDDEAHLIIEVKTTDEIPAKHLFGLGYEILQLVDDFANFAGIDVSSDDLLTTVNINSPGKIDLKAKIKKTTVVAGLIVFIAGGGLKTKTWELASPGIPGLIKAWDEYQTHSQEREMRMKMFEQYKDSLHVKDPEDLIKLLKQVSDNKDLSK
jgi:restriction system protein